MAAPCGLERGRRPDQLHVPLLEKLRSKKQLDWGRAVIDFSHVRAARRGPKAGPARSAAQLQPLLDKIPPVAGRVGRPRRRPKDLPADRAYDHDKYRRLLRQRGIRPVIARRGEPHGTGLGVFRYVVERTIAWLHGFRRLRIRWEGSDDLREAFLGLAVCLITHRQVRRLC